LLPFSPCGLAVHNYAFCSRGLVAAAQQLKQRVEKKSEPFWLPSGQHDAFAACTCEKELFGRACPLQFAWVAVHDETFYATRSVTTMKTGQWFFFTPSVSATCLISDPEVNKNSSLLQQWRWDYISLVVVLWR
jgi:hypothetical protein